MPKKSYYEFPPDSGIKHDRSGLVELSKERGLAIRGRPIVLYKRLMKHHNDAYVRKGWYLKFREFPPGSGNLYDQSGMSELLKERNLSGEAPSLLILYQRLMKHYNGAYVRKGTYKRTTYKTYEFPEGSGKEYTMKELRHLCEINNLRYAGTDAKVFHTRLTKHLAKPTTTFIYRRSIKIRRKKKVTAEAAQLFSDAMVSIVVKVNVVDGASAEP